MELNHYRLLTQIESFHSMGTAAKELKIGAEQLQEAIAQAERCYSIAIFHQQGDQLLTTWEGEQLLHYIREILARFDALERSYIEPDPSPLDIKLSIPRASYISHAFTRFLGHLPPADALRVHLSETNSLQCIHNLIDNQYDLAIIRYERAQEDYFLAVLEAKGLDRLPVFDYRYQLLLSETSPLARQMLVFENDLDPLIEIAHGDQPRAGDLPDPSFEHLQNAGHNRIIYVYERGSQFDLLATLPSYMWVSPMPRATLKRYHMLQKQCPTAREMRDIAVFRRGHILSKSERQFLRVLHEVIGEISVDCTP